ncbi:MAG: multidrug ABC transporter substrate-binding protein [Nitrospirae bacterium RBG_16_64_22]|nr:MAG: multidrug ABC transporter substrate-binding protein [Nitrospirae bacterium RBG_16_64_22]
MDLNATFRIALRALRRNRLRSFLTALGVIIGVGAVIAMVALGEGAQRTIERQMEEFGTNVLMIFAGSAGTGGRQAGIGSLPTLTLDDAKAIEKEVPTVSLVTATVRTQVVAVYGNQNWTTSAFGVTPEFAAVRQWKVAAGRFINQEDMEGEARVVLLGQTVAENLFGNADPVNETIRIKNLPMKVIGVLAKKGTTISGSDADDVLYLPLPVAMKRIQGTTRLGSIQIQTQSTEDLPLAEEQTTALLRQRHGIPLGEPSDFVIRNFSERLSAREEQARTFKYLLAGIASVSLAVGGIGIMNIMLVSVTERTKEIGIRMAVGATERDILSQFLVEAVALSVVGGILGIMLGIGGSLVMGWMGMGETSLSLWPIVLAFAVSGLVGVFFGFWPARKAARLDPIEALRYE